MKIALNEIDSMDKSSFDLLVNPNIVGVHKTSRVLVFDSISDMLVFFINEQSNRHIVTMKEFKSKKNVSLPQRRYCFHGGDKGDFCGFFSDSDSLVYVVEDGIRSMASSISSWNLAHFFCDCFDTEDKTKVLEDWIFKNAVLVDFLKDHLKEHFSK